MAKKQKNTQPLTPQEEYFNKICGSYLKQFPMGNVLIIGIAFTYICLSMVMVDMSKPIMESGIIKYLIIGLIIAAVTVPVALKLNNKQKLRPQLVKKYITTSCNNEDFIKVDTVFAQLILYKEPTDEELKKAVELRTKCFVNGEFDMGKLQYYAIYLNEMKKKYNLGPAFTVIIERSQQYESMMQESAVNFAATAVSEDAPVYAPESAPAEFTETAAEHLQAYVHEESSSEEAKDSKFNLAAKRKLCTMVVMQLKAQFPFMVADQTNLQKNIEMIEKEYRRLRNIPSDIKIYDPLNGWINPEFITFIAGFITCNKKKVFKL